jgi:hypothetical protein
MKPTTKLKQQNKQATRGDPAACKLDKNDGKKSTNVRAPAWGRHPQQTLATE